MGTSAPVAMELPQPPSWAPAALFLAALALALWLALLRSQRRQQLAPAPTPAAPPLSPAALRRRAAARAFVRAHVEAAAGEAGGGRVAFAADERRAAPLRALFGALGAPLEVVDLARVAGGALVLRELRAWGGDGQAQGQEREQERGQDQEQDRGGQSFLFLRGALVGDWARVRAMLSSGELRRAVPDGHWASVRLDPRAESGFAVRSASNAFQSLAEVEAEPDVDGRREVRPLRSARELRGVRLDELAACSVPLAHRAREQSRRSKLLVCHDMKGGYLGDRFRQGSSDYDEYRFYQWDLVDTFVYFSHALVTIPPVGWVAAGHRHGSRVLGTFITEGDAGQALATELFVDAQSAERYAAKLVAIAWRSGFDGWLINLENTIPPALIPNVLTFLRVLRNGLRVNNPHAQVIWYGCLAKDGKSKHQVRLDGSSEDFFECVDGFFSDYGWTADDAKFSAAFKLDRRYDIYMGVDVFGRHGTLDGGKLESYKSLRLAWNCGISVAVFAPGWTFECYRHEAQLPFAIAEDNFWQRMRASWRLRSPCFNSLGSVNCFYSAFNSGRGHGVWINGSQVSRRDWSNLSEMDIQPISELHRGVQIPTRAANLTATIEDRCAFQGGSCVKVTGKLTGHEKKYFKLFHVDIVFTPRRITEISYVCSSSDSSTSLLVLKLCPGIDHTTHQIILGSGTEDKDNLSPATSDSSLSIVSGSLPGRHFLAPVSNERFAGPTPTGWERKTYRVGGQLWDDKHIVEIGVLCTTSSAARKLVQLEKQEIDYVAFVGEVCVVGCEPGVPRAVPRSARDEPQLCINPRIMSLVRTNNTNTIAFGIRWDFSSDGEPVQYVLVHICKAEEPQERVYMGKSFEQAFWVDRCLIAHQGDEEGPDMSSSPPPVVATIELQCVSWAGRVGAQVCRLHIEP